MNAFDWITTHQLKVSDGRTITICPDPMEPNAYYLREFSNRYIRHHRHPELKSYLDFGRAAQRLAQKEVRA